MSVQPHAPACTRARLADARFMIMSDIASPVLPVSLSARLNPRRRRSASASSLVTAARMMTTIRRRRRRSRTGTQTSQRRTTRRQRRSRRRTRSLPLRKKRRTRRGEALVPPLALASRPSSTMTPTSMSLRLPLVEASPPSRPQHLHRSRQLASDHSSPSPPAIGSAMRMSRRLRSLR